jgi:hypothetical protein
LSPLAVRIEVLSSPDIVVVVLPVITLALSQLLFALVNPCVPHIAGGGY